MYGRYWNEQLFNVINIGNVTLSSININNNCATQYIVFDGTSFGDLYIMNTHIMNNNNDNLLIRATFVEMHNFDNGNNSEGNPLIKVLM